MKTIEELQDAIKMNVLLVWNDPQPIKNQNYDITYIEPITDDFDVDTPILIQYGYGSEAEVLLSEISV